MKCPHCESEESFVLDSRPSANGLRRRRKCTSCAQKFTTYELNAEEVPGVSFSVNDGVNRHWRAHRDELLQILEAISPEDKAVLLSVARRLRQLTAERRAA